jgi:hypothetical protein
MASESDKNRVYGSDQNLIRTIRVMGIIFWVSGGVV